MNAKPIFRRLLVLLCGFLLAFEHSASLAADQVEILEEVVVTATRRTQTVSQVPLLPRSPETSYTPGE
ncbi:MAG: hypothetical protein R3E64_09435 [Halioglobus sp.]